MGSLDDTAASAISTLTKEDMLHIQLTRKANPDQILRLKNMAVAFPSTIIHEPEDLASDVGVFLDKCNYCFQGSLEASTMCLISTRIV